MVPFNPVLSSALGLVIPRQQHELLLQNDPVETSICSAARPGDRRVRSRWGQAAGQCLPPTAAAPHCAQRHPPAPARQPSPASSPLLPKSRGGGASPIRAPQPQRDGAEPWLSSTKPGAGAQRGMTVLRRRGVSAAPSARLPCASPARNRQSQMCLINTPAWKHHSCHSNASRRTLREHI